MVAIQVDARVYFPWLGGPCPWGPIPGKQREPVLLTLGDGDQD